MKQAGYSKRSHGRSSERQRQHSRQISREGSDCKVRGSAQQCVEKYLTLARDAASSGDPISAENYYQYADHYYRLSIAARSARGGRSEVSSERKPISPPPKQKPSETLSLDLD